MPRFSIVLLGSALVFVSVVDASASQFMSRYSDLDFEKCTLVHEESEFGFVQWKCTGAYGYDVYATEADLRFYLTFKPEGHALPSSAVEEPSDVSVETLVDEEADGGDGIGQTIAPFNTLGPKLEWRASNERDAEPFATIVRYHYQTPDDEGGFDNGQILVVSRFRNGRSCQVAYIDAKANGDANLMARNVADRFADAGKCPKGAVPVVSRGGEDFRF